MPARIRLSFDDAEHIAEVRGGQIRLDGADQPFRVAPSGDDTYRVTSGADGEVRVVGVSSGVGVWVTIDGHVFEITSQAASGRGQSRGRDHDVLGPPMPATVVRIAVKPGDAVRAGDVLIALEAMKMELPIRAPRDGIVAAVHCEAGELVQPGVTLIEIGP